MDYLDLDAVVVGSGCAGYNCADWLHTLGVTNIALVTESRTAGTSRNTGSDKQTYYKLSLAGDEPDSVLALAQTLFAGGAVEGDLALAEAAGSVRCFMKLAELGVAFPTNEYGEYVGYQTDHDPRRRASSIGPYTSRAMTERLEARVLKKKIRLLDELRAIELLVEDGAAAGLLCLGRARGGKPHYTAIRAPCVVLATGGPALIYADSVYPASQTGGSSLALQAGAQFANLSEWQYGIASVDFRWNLSGSYQQALPRYISVDENGVEREFLRPCFDDPAELLHNIFLKGYEWPFDVRRLKGSSCIDLLVAHESVDLGRKVYLDFTREPCEGVDLLRSLRPEAARYLAQCNALTALPIERLRRINPAAVELFAAHGIDLARQPLRIAVCAQHSNGGIRVDPHWETSVKGLYAIGEAAGTFGIFRPGGAALNSCQVGGMRAAQQIAGAGRRQPPARFEALAAEAAARADRLIAATHADRSTLTAARQRYEKRMSRSFGFVRHIPEMTFALGQITADLDRFEADNRWARPEELPRLFQNLDLLLMQQAAASAILYAAGRFGSRGSACVLGHQDPMDRVPVPEEPSGRSEVIVLQKRPEISLWTEPVRPIPERELWFERVWNQKRPERGAD